MDGAPDLEHVVAGIRSMRVRGAGRIGRHAAAALAEHVAGCPAGTDPVAHAEAGAARLLATRPTAVTLHNAVAWVLAAVVDATGHEGGVAGTGRVTEAAHAAAKGVADRQVAQQAALEAMAERLAGRRVLTHCHSSTATGILAAAHRIAPVEMVCTETRPFDQGRITSAELASLGIPVTLVVDSAVATMLRDVDQVLVGVDTMAGDGALYNKVGTAAVALLAQDAGLPFEAAMTWDKATDALMMPVEERDPAEVWKDPPAGVRVHNPVFDRTPPERIGAFWTPAGLLGPADAVAAAARHGPPPGARQRVRRLLQGAT